MTRAERIEAALRTLHRTVRGYEAESCGHVCRSPVCSPAAPEEGAK